MAKEYSWMSSCLRSSTTVDMGDMFFYVLSLGIFVVLAARR